MNRIAIVKLSAMGDIIHAMVALQFIRQKYPNLIIDWFVEEGFKSVLEDNPDINNIYTVNLKSIKKNKLSLFTQIKLIKKYSKNNYDLVIDAQGLIKSAIVSKLLGKNVAGFSKNSIRENFASFFYDIKVDIPYDKNVIERNLKVITAPLKIEVNKNSILEKKHFLFYKCNAYGLVDEYLSVSKKNIVLIIGASWPSKMYSKEQFIKLVKHLNANCLIAWGNEAEKNIAEYISSNSNAVLLPKLNLDTLKYLISKSDLVIGNDTGPTHMAWALNRPSITLFGNTPGYRNTYVTSTNLVIESTSVVDPYNLNRSDYSISEISPSDISNIAKSLLDG